ncbi:MAG: hypothetical protein LLG20_13870 [Acidobacteriales bacterium]|nr:hypothetical protein [Terriglobales bacterium]
MSYRDSIAVVLSAVLCLAPTVQAQQGVSVKARDDGSTVTLRIIVLDGQNAINSIPLRTFATPVVEVRNENDLPVEGANVTFSLPQVGPGAFFPGQQTSLKTRTNVQGQAAATGFRPNSEPGPFLIRVTASFGGRTGNVVINQVNSAKEVPAGAQVQPKKSSRKWLWIALAAGGAAAGGAIWATRGGESAASASTLTLIPGVISVGNPR